MNAKLKRLDLSGNPLSDAGAVLLSAGLKENASLEFLKWVVLYRDTLLTLAIN